MRVIVTGATGFIGGFVVTSLSKENEVIALTRDITSTIGRDRIRQIKQDLTLPLNRSELPDRSDAVVHFAQSRFYRQFPEKAEDIFAVNVLSTMRLLEYARYSGANCFLLASTGGVYGSGTGSFPESEPPRPESFYARSKFAAEMLAQSYRQFFRVVVVRYFFVYGPGQYGMLIPTLLNKVVNGKQITIEGNPGIRINPIFISDAIRVVESSLRLPKSATINVCGDEIVTITELVKTMEEVTNSTARIQYKESSMRGDIIGDNQLMKKCLRVFPDIRLGEGLKQLASDLRQ